MAIMWSDDSSLTPKPKPGPAKVAAPVDAPPERDRLPGAVESPGGGQRENDPRPGGPWKPWQVNVLLAMAALAVLALAGAVAYVLFAKPSIEPTVTVDVGKSLDNFTGDVRDWLPVQLGGKEDINRVIDTMAGVATEAGVGVADALRELVPTTPDERSELGKKLHQQLVNKYGMALQKVDQRNEPELFVVWNKVKGKVDQKKLEASGAKLELYIIEDPDMVNAMALLNGGVYIYAGLLYAIRDNRDAIAFVLGHEIAHIVNRDTDTILAQLGFVSRLSQGFPLSDQLLMKFIELSCTGYERKREFKADEDGYRLALNAGYSREKMLLFFDEINEGGGSGKAPGNPVGRAVFRIVNHFESHPPTMERKEELEKLK
jgi:hypothetical protein